MTNPFIHITCHPLNQARFDRLPEHIQTFLKKLQCGWCHKPFNTNFILMHPTERSDNPEENGMAVICHNCLKQVQKEQPVIN